jgi:hypothetical protein
MVQFIVTKNKLRDLEGLLDAADPWTPALGGLDVSAI